MSNIVINKEQSIEQTINNVMSEISAIGYKKGGKNDSQGYKYRSIDDAYAVLSPVLSSNGLIISSSNVDNIHERITVGKYNTPAIHVLQKIKYTVRHVHNKETIEFEQWGEAMDTADKAFNKAFTAAYKYMVINFFCMPVEGQEDADSSTPERSTPPAKSSVPTPTPAPAPATKTPTPTPVENGGNNTDFDRMTQEIYQAWNDNYDAIAAKLSVKKLDILSSSIANGFADYDLDKLTATHAFIMGVK